MPPDHPLRRELNDEVHARPPDTLLVPLRVSYLALVPTEPGADESWQHLCALIASQGGTPPSARSKHYRVDFGAFRVRYEQHTEFFRFSISVPGAGRESFDDYALAALPAGWVEGLPGRVMVAAHALLVKAPAEPPDFERISTTHFNGNMLVGAAIAGGAATALTDFTIHDDGFGRFLVQDRSMTPRQAGRMLQRLLEIDTYRMMALLALPVARELTPLITECERELSGIATLLAGTDEADEPVLLDRLTRLEAEIESREADNHYRFGAAEAYYELVKRRIVELRESRIQGLPTFVEFTERRLAPAMSTCTAIATRQEALSERVSRATQLLSTRVDVTRERQNQQLLESMNRRAKAQLRLQQTVEGLSVAAITYYIVGLVGYGAKGFVALGLRIDPELAMAVSIPVVALGVAYFVRRVRRRVTRTVD